MPASRHAWQHIPRLKGAKITVESHVKVAGKGADAFWEIRPRGWLGGDLRCVMSPKVTIENEWFFQVKTLFLVGGVSYEKLFFFTLKFGEDFRFQF